jgi:Uma2 family endonuclease
MAIAARKRYTYADFLRFPDDGNRHEILDGLWIMTPPPTTDHQRIIINLIRILDPFIQTRKLGLLLASPVGVVLSQTRVVQPDLLFVAKSRESIVHEDAVHGAPELLIEVLSPSTASLDRGRKLKAYEASGVREYWIVDRDARTVEVHGFGRSPKLRVLQTGQSFQSDVLPGLTVRVNEVFRGVR